MGIYTYSAALDITGAAAAEKVVVELKGAAGFRVCVRRLELFTATAGGYFRLKRNGSAVSDGTAALVVPGKHNPAAPTASAVLSTFGGGAPTESGSAVSMHSTGGIGTLATIRIFGDSTDNALLLIGAAQTFTVVQVLASSSAFGFIEWDEVS